MVDWTDHERAAIKAARRPLAEVLTELHLMEHFAPLTAEQIDGLIEVVVLAYRRFLVTHPDPDVPF